MGGIQNEDWITQMVNFPRVGLRGLAVKPVNMHGVSIHVVGMQVVSICTYPPKCHVSVAGIHPRSLACRFISRKILVTVLGALGALRVRKVHIC